MATKRKSILAIGRMGRTLAPRQPPIQRGVLLSQTIFAGERMDPFQQFMRTLSRLRQQAPMPVAPDELLAVLFPDWWLSLGGARHSIQEGNVMRIACLDVPPVMAPLTVRIPARHGNDVSVFWFMAQVHRYSELNPDLEVMLPWGGPVAHAVAVWYGQALAIERQIAEAVNTIEPLFRSSVHPVVAYKEWPQLQTIAPLPSRNEKHCLRKGEAENLLRGIPTARRERIATSFANALMLPDTKLTAWVNRYDDTMGGG